MLMPRFYFGEKVVEDVCTNVRTEDGGRTEDRGWMDLLGAVVCSNGTTHFLPQPPSATPSITLLSSRFWSKGEA
jgi:hypothetical protein